MKTKCPHCCDGRENCEECGGTRFVEVRFAEGDVFTRNCLACGEHNGGRIHDGIPPEPPGDCVWCGSDNVEWLLIGDTREAMT